MIRTDSQTAIRGLIDRLKGKAERIAQGRASGLFARTNGRSRHSHTWRNASSLWPDLFKD
ncbi:MAG: hypothetical protein WBA51_15170 [Erythrobacter sp.]